MKTGSDLELFKMSLVQFTVRLRRSTSFGVLVFSSALSTKMAAVDPESLMRAQWEEKADSLLRTAKTLPRAGGWFFRHRFRGVAGLGVL